MLKADIKTISSSDNEFPFVSVIIPVYNDADRLSNCLSALERQTYPYQSFEVIVVDNASNENFAPIIENHPHVRILFQNRKGSYAARNKGIPETKGQIIAFTDSDCLPASDWIEKGVNQLIITNNCGIIGGRVKLFYKNRSNPTAVEVYDSVTFFQQQFYIEKAHFSVTANLFTFKSVFENVGLFNDKLGSGGDIEWCRRVYASGLGLYYADDAIVKHPARHSISQMVKKVIRVTKGRFEMDIEKNNILQKFIQILSKDVMPPIGRIRKVWGYKPIKGPVKKVQVTAVLLAMKYVALIEKLKLLISTISDKHIWIRNLK